MFKFIQYPCIKIRITCTILICNEFNYLIQQYG